MGYHTRRQRQGRRQRHAFQGGRHAHRDLLLAGEETVEDRDAMAEHRHFQAVLLAHVVEQSLQSYVRVFQIKAIPDRPFPLLPQETARRKSC